MRSSLATSLLIWALAAFSPVVHAQPVMPIGMVDDPCEGLEPGKLDVYGLCRYRDENAAQHGRPDLVLYGDSITEGWAKFDPDFFAANPKLVDRGISGQTSAQMLVRFHADVVALKPRRVQIMAGTNDVAGNQGPTSEQAWRDNIIAMVEIARAHHIEPVLASIPPAAAFWWRKEVQPAQRIVALNTWLRAYAKAQRLRYVDYYAVLVGEGGALKYEYGEDGVHPNAAGYAVMRPLARALLLKP
jgi:lysophospholipase L1-like esterase